MKRMGLVLCGGGGKGAYFIGVWKALHEYGVDSNVTDISGTSVGALNAVLFAQEKLNVAEDIWKNISSDEILKFDYKCILKQILHIYNIKSAIGSSVGLLLNTYGNGIFSREGLLNIIDNNVDLELVKTSLYNIYVTVFNISKFDVEYLKINNKEHEDIKKILLASSAIPIVFEPEEINGDTYYDGGLKDNIPIKPLYDSGVRNFIVVHLSRDSILDKDKYKDANIIEIVPNDDQGDLITGTLDFSREGSIRRIQQGYRDAVKMLKPIYEMGVVQRKISNCLKSFKENESNFRNEHKRKILEREKLKGELNDLINCR